MIQSKKNTRFTINFDSSKIVIFVKAGNKKKMLFFARLLVVYCLNFKN